MKLYGKDPKQPNYARPEYIETLPDLELIEHEMGGTRTMHANSTTYIRKWTAEKPGNYKIRRLCETFFEGFGRTLSAAVGMMFAKSPSVEWNKSEELMSPHWDNIDGGGVNGPVAVKRFGEAALRDGLAIWLVDHPAAPEVQPTADNPTAEVTGKMVEALNLRPMWSMYRRIQAINWLVEVVDNRRELTQLTLVEGAAVRDDGNYGIKQVTRYRDLRLTTNADGVRVASWTLRELVEGIGINSGTFKDIGSGVFRNKNGDAATSLPIAIAYTGRTEGPMECAIPLLGVAWANLSHWQLSTSLRFNTEVAGLAQPTVIGDLAKDPITGKPMQLDIGPLVSVHVAEGGDFKWSEPAGTGLERLSLLVLEKLRQIAALGVSFLTTDTRAAETAEAKRLDAAAENATLATAAVGIEDAVNLALEIHAWYLGIEKKDAPVITISRDYEDTTISAEIMTAYIKAISEAGLPIRLMLEAWQQGGRIAPGVDLDALEAEMTANAIAIEDEKQRLAEERALQMGNANPVKVPLEDAQHEGESALPRRSGSAHSTTH